MILVLMAFAFILLFCLFLEKSKSHRRIAQLELLQKELSSKELLIKELSEEQKLRQEERLALKLENNTLSISLEEMKKSLEDKIVWLEGSKEKLVETFKSLSFESLQKSNEAFLSLASQSFEKLHEKAEGTLEKKTTVIHSLFDPMKETLSKLSEGVSLLEKERKADHEVLKSQMKLMQEAEKELKDETSKLIRALRTPIVRGRWGEIQLRRVVEMTGMVSHCDFFEQQQSESLRPDMIIRLPGNRQVIVDAKTPFEAYFDAMQTEDLEKRAELLSVHARHLRAHVASLSKKAYWENFEPTPEFVVLFLPSESFFSAALEQDPSLIEIGVDQKVVIATPVSLIGLLKAISYGWKQENLTRHTKEIYELGKELYKRIFDMNSHLQKLGKSLTHSVEHYNKTIGSFETRVLVSARKFEALSVVSDKDLELQEPIDLSVREMLLDQSI